MHIKHPPLNSSKLVQLFLLTCMSGNLYVSMPAIANPENSPVTEQLILTKSKKQLAREIILDLGINKKYDLYFWNSVDIIQSRPNRTKFGNWLQQTLAKVAGWTYVESDYVSALESNFSESELQELVKLSKNPLMKKLLMSEIQAYEQTGVKRAQLLWKAWDDYNSGKIYVPNGLW